MAEHDEQVAVIEYCDLKGILYKSVFCDAYRKINPKQRGVIMQAGDKYGRLTVTEIFSKGRKQYAKCVCDCGNQVTTRADGLTSGHTKSCGCYKRDIQRKRMTARNTTHGQSKTRLYRIYYDIIRRCYNSKFSKFRYYGGRGINVCDEWRHSFAAFRKWAEKNGYSDSLTIDRIDNNGNYCPENCRWITQAEQLRNTSRVRLITFNGETKTLSEWAECTGLKQECIRNRIDRLGWSIEDALTKEVVKA